MDLTELERRFLAPWAEAARDTAPVFVRPGAAAAAAAVPVDEAAPSLAAWAGRRGGGECWDGVRFPRAFPRAGRDSPAGRGAFPPPAPEDECPPAWRAAMRALAAAQEELGGLVIVAAAGLHVGLAHLCRRAAQHVDVVFVGAPPPGALGRVLDVTLACLARAGWAGRGGGYHVSAAMVLAETGDSGFTVTISREVAADFRAVFAGRPAAGQVLYTPADRQLGFSRSAALAYATGCVVAARVESGADGPVCAGFASVGGGRAADPEADGEPDDCERFARVLVGGGGATPGTIALISYDPLAAGVEKTAANSIDTSALYAHQKIRSLDLFGLARLFTEERLRALAAAAFAAEGGALDAFDAVVDAQALDVQSRFAALAAAAREEFAAAPLRPAREAPPPDALLELEELLADAFPALGGLHFSD